MILLSGWGSLHLKECERGLREERGREPLVSVWWSESFLTVILHILEEKFVAALILNAYNSFCNLIVQLVSASH